MDENTQVDAHAEIERLREYIASAEQNLEEARKALSELTGEEFKATPNLSGPVSSADGKIIEGIFNGENMVGPNGKIFPVPANYASKSKLIDGDRLKLTVAEDGSFIFKQIGPAERRKAIGNLVFENNAYHVTAEGKNYNVLYASVTYFKAKPGDKVTIILPKNEESQWAALENIIHDVVVPASEETSAASEASAETQIPVPQEDIPEVPVIEMKELENEMTKEAPYTGVEDLPDFPAIDDVAPEASAEPGTETATTETVVPDTTPETLEAPQPVAEPEATPIEIKPERTEVETENFFDSIPDPAETRNNLGESLEPEAQPAEVKELEI